MYEHDTGQWEEALTRSKVTMIVRLHKGEASLSSHNAEK
jgi:hypothetical protein